MSTTTVSLKLQLNGQQAINQIKQTNFSIEQSQKTQKQNLGGILQTQNRINQSTQQAGRYSQQQLRSGQSMLQTNRLLAQILQQQQRQGSLISQQLRQQERSYQVQLNHLRAQVAQAERLRQQLQQAGNAQRDLNRGGTGGGGNLLGNAVATAGGVYAGGMIVSNALKDPREYRKQVAYATDTAIGSKNVTDAEYLQMVNKMDGFVRNAAKKGGATPWETIAGLNTLTASNVFEFDELEKQLLLVSKTAFASGANADDVAKMSIAQRNFGLTDLNRANEMAMRSGQVGSFELRDMARYMPDLLTQGKNAGYIGEKGYQHLLSLMQISMKTAADPSQAAVNLSDLMGGFSQYHFGLQMAKHINVQKGDPIAAYGIGKKKVGFDWTTYASSMQEKGIGQEMAAAMLVQRQMQMNPLYKQYEAKYQEADRKYQEALKNKDNVGAQVLLQEAKDNLQAAQNIVAQSEVGKIFHNKQQLSAFMAILMNLGEDGALARIEKETEDSVGAVDTSNRRINLVDDIGADGSFDTATYFAKVDSYKNNSGWLSDVKTSAYEWINENEAMAGSMATATTTLIAFTAMAGVATLAMGKMGGTSPLSIRNGRGLPASATGTGGQALVAGALGYGIGTVISNAIEGTEASDYIGREIAKLWQFAPEWLGGGQIARDALDAEWYAKQEQQNQELIQKQEEQKQAVEKQTKAVQEMGILMKNFARQPPVQINGFSLLDAMSQSNQTESNRHGSVPSTPWIFKP